MIFVTPPSNPKKATKCKKKKMYKNNTYGLAMDMIIWLLIDGKYNSLTKFGYDYGEIWRRTMKEEGEGNICIFVLNGTLGISPRGIYVLKKFIKRVDIYKERLDGCIHNFSMTKGTSINKGTMIIVETIFVIKKNHF